MAHNRQTGNIAELEAQRYLEKRGLSLCEKNFSCKAGEIDLIMKEGKTLIFIEVRYRHSRAYGTAAETISPTKQRKIIRATQFYLQQQGLWDKVACRFDVIGMDNDISKITWIKNAFEAGEI